MFKVNKIIRIQWEKHIDTVLGINYNISLR